MKSTTCHIPLKAGTKRREEKALPTGYQIRSDSAVPECVCVRGYKGCMTMQAKSLHYRDYRRKFNPATRNRQQHDTTRRREAEAEAAAASAAAQLILFVPLSPCSLILCARSRVSTNVKPLSSCVRSSEGLACLPRPDLPRRSSRLVSHLMCACLACLPACILESSLSLSPFLSLRVFALRTC